MYLDTQVEHYRVLKNTDVNDPIPTFGRKNIITYSIMDLVVFLSEGCEFTYFSWWFHVYRIKVLNMHPCNQVSLSAVSWNLVAMIKGNPVKFIVFFWNRLLVSCVCSVIPVHLHILSPSLLVR